MRLNIRPGLQPNTTSLRRQRRRWDEGDALPMSIGCTGCTDLSMCGGSHKLRHAYSCLDDCCGEPDSCDGMCPNNPVGFRDRMREINGLELENVPRATPCAAAALPGYIPYIYHGNRRAVPLDIEAVALPLRRFYRANGDLIFRGVRKWMRRSASGHKHASF